MKRCLPFVFLFLCCSLLEGQSLVELAKQEKERRKQNADAGRKASIDAEGGGTRPLSEEPVNSQRPLTREEAIAALGREYERLTDEAKRMFDECGREMKERGYEKISNNLISCAEARKLDKKRYSVAQEIQDLKDGKMSVLDVREETLKPNKTSKGADDAKLQDPAKIKARIKELEKEAAKEYERCNADIGLYGVTKGVEIPSCRYANDLRAEIRSLEKKLR